MRTVAFVLGLLLPFTLASPVQQKRADMVLVPGVGYLPQTSTHLVPEGGKVVTVGDEVHLLNAAGEVLHASKIDSSASARLQKRVDGWQVAGVWEVTGSSAIKTFTTKWAVPPVPATNHGQTLFLFNSIEPSAQNAILQPVLQFGPSAAGGGSFWAVASWYISPSNQAFFTNPVQVSAGTVLTGVITLNSQSGSTYSYTTDFSGISGTTLNASGAQLVWATETLETYGVVAPTTDNPVGTTSFNSIAMTFTGTAPTVNWSIDDFVPGDSITGTVAAQGATGSGDIVIHYPEA